MAESFRLYMSVPLLFLNNLCTALPRHAFSGALGAAIFSPYALRRVDSEKLSQGFSGRQSFAFLSVMTV